MLARDKEESNSSKTGRRVTAVKQREKQQEGDRKNDNSSKVERITLV